MEALGSRQSRASSRYASGPSPPVFAGRVRKWRKQWVTSPAATISKSGKCNDAPPLRLCHWTPSPPPPMTCPSAANSATLRLRTSCLLQTSASRPPPTTALSYSLSTRSCHDHARLAAPPLLPPCPVAPPPCLTVHSPALRRLLHAAGSTQQTQPAALVIHRWRLGAVADSNQKK
ncbi:hypothetical protein SASPL_122698 [Salvia splendens]|uniref:Uncharacterized protein n=1 Tax=Salvia splendens TaxID=180675 RepID=A0A8X8ZRG4_SALSN|nr:hypothetical protein SASPL_122698 [Salvia splendens]